MPHVLRLATLLALLALAQGCVNYDLAGVPSKDLGVGHLYERLPATAKVALFRDGTTEGQLPSRLLGRATDAFTTSLKRTDLFERVVNGTGDQAEFGFDASIQRLECAQNYGCVWLFLNPIALFAVAFNLPLSIDEATYEVQLRAIHVPTATTLGTYTASVHLRSWRGAWTLYETWLEDPGQVFDIVDRKLLQQVVEDYPRLKQVMLRPPGEAPR